MGIVTRATDKVGTLGVIISAASCPGCFPALASLGAAAGIGFLGEYEGLFIRILLPLFAAAALAANAIAGLVQRRWRRALFGSIGPVLVIAASVLFLGQWWAPNLLYTGLVLMVAVSIWDLARPNRPRCATDSCERMGQSP